MALAAITLAAAPASAQGGFGTVAVEDDLYGLTDYEADIGQAEFNFQWGTVANQHNIRQDTKLFRSGAPTSDDNASYLLRLTSGTYHFYCEVHGSPSGGMDAEYRIVPDIVEETGDTVKLDLGHVTEGYVGNRWDAKYRVNNGKWRTWFRNRTKHFVTFGKNNAPVDYDADKAYDVKVRSELRSNPERHSTFSPPLGLGVI